VLDFLSSTDVGKIVPTAEVEDNAPAWRREKRGHVAKEKQGPTERFQQARLEDDQGIIDFRL
jgi:hypothetical protein